MSYDQSERALRKMRQRIFDYDGTPKEAQAARVLAYLKKRKLRGPEYQPRVLNYHWMYAAEGLTDPLTVGNQRRRQRR